MTYTYEGNEYQVINQMGTFVQLTKAYRMLDFNQIELITVDEYKSLGHIEVQKITLHSRDFIDLAALIGKGTVSVL